MFLDGDSLGAINDNVNHEAGDNLMRLWGRAIKSAGLEDSYHIHGDEFVIEADTQEELEKAQKAISSYLKDKYL
jgi:GGDEF domain-containing protein